MLDLHRPTTPSGGGAASGKDLIVGDLYAGVLKTLPHGFTTFTSMQLQLKDATNNDVIDQLYYDTTNVYIKATVDVPAAAGLIVSCVVYNETPTPAPTPRIVIAPVSAIVTDSPVKAVITGTYTNFQNGDTVTDDLGTIAVSAVVVISQTEIHCTFTYIDSAIATHTITVNSTATVSTSFKINPKP